MVYTLIFIVFYLYDTFIMNIPEVSRKMTFIFYIDYAQQTIQVISYFTLHNFFYNGNTSKYFTKPLSNSVYWLVIMSILIKNK